jgi:hypothetical protein
MEKRNGAAWIPAGDYSSALHILRRGFGTMPARESGRQCDNSVKAMEGGSSVKLGQFTTYRYPGTTLLPALTVLTAAKSLHPLRCEKTDLHHVGLPSTPISAPGFPGNEIHRHLLDYWQIKNLQREIEDPTQSFP